MVYELRTGLVVGRTDNKGWVTKNNVMGVLHWGIIDFLNMLYICYIYHDFIFIKQSYFVYMTNDKSNGRQYNITVYLDG